mmetsp:Transcript_19497/g.32781  ORF Transcript_19497/g.32781 Transcript_19497/m.32781 type:complete len:201 (+) Transcript_19497:795-1397(+)
MTAPLGPAPAMVGKLSSMNPPWAVRNSISFKPTSASVTLRSAASSASIHTKNWAIAVASRKCASTIPASSLAFFTALASCRGVCASNTPTGGRGTRPLPDPSAPFLPFFDFACAFLSMAFCASFAAARAACITASELFCGSTHTIPPACLSASMASFLATLRLYGRTSTLAAFRCAATSVVTLRTSQYSTAAPISTSAYP